MQKYYDTVLGSDGSPLSGAEVTIYNTGTLVKPTIYSDNGVTPAANPLTTDSRGMFAFYAADGRYDVKIEKSGYGSFTLTDVAIDEQDTAGTIAFTPTGSIAANTVAGALAELDGDITTLSAAITSALAGKAASAHTHVATDVSVTPAGAIAATNVQAALQELDSEKASIASGSYTATATGMTTSPTGGVDYVRSGSLVSLQIPTISGTSNSTSFTLTGMPVGIRPSANRACTCRLQDNGAYYFGLAVIGADGTISLFKDASGSVLTSSGTKGVADYNITYMI